MKLCKNKQLQMLMTKVMPIWKASVFGIQNTLILIESTKTQ